MSRPANTVSSSEIVQSYFGHQKQHRLLDAAATPSQGALTPVTTYLLREARTLLSQRQLEETQLALSDSELLEIIKHVEEVEGESLSERERTAAVAALSASLEHYDLLTPLIENPDINDIIIRAFNDISVQTGRRNVQTDYTFPDHSSYKSFVENILKRAGKSCTVATPVVDVAVDPHVRACVTHESFSPPGSGPMLTLRIARHRDISLSGLVQHELAPTAVFDYLSALVAEGHQTILVAGEVGTGKTTLVKALASQIGDEDALLIIEDTHEISLSRRFVRTLLTRESNTEGAGRISPAQAIRTGMRMAMNRIILGEMRDAEAAEAFIDVCASGHAGMSTIHARSARDAIARLELFLARAQGAIGIENIRRQIANAISIVIYLGIDAQNNRRRLMEVLEVGTSADGVVQTTPIFSFLPTAETPSWKATLGMSRYSAILRCSLAEFPLVDHILSFDPNDMYRRQV